MKKQAKTSQEKKPKQTFRFDPARYDYLDEAPFDLLIEDQ
jgi:hypothetical protein